MKYLIIATKEGQRVVSKRLYSYGKIKGIVLGQYDNFYVAIDALK